MKDRKELISILSKKREEYYQSLPTNNGDKELRLYIDIVCDILTKDDDLIHSSIIKQGRTKPDSRLISYWIYSLLDIKIKEESIKKVISFKKVLCLRNNQRTYRIYRQSF